jgi:hypothetical protein
MSGAVDGARTRDLRRDRPVEYLSKSKEVSTLQVGSRGAFKGEVETAARSDLPPENENPGASVADATGANIEVSYNSESYRKPAAKSTPNADLDAIVSDDRAFFATNLGRQHRVRYASQAEIAEGMAGRLEGKFFPLFIIVRQIEPGLRLRVLVALDRDFNGCGERSASNLWSQYHQGMALEAAVKAAAVGGRK